MTQKRDDALASRQAVLDCADDIRKAAARCEAMGMLAAWATLLDVVDHMLAAVDRPPDARS